MTSYIDFLHKISDEADSISTYYFVRQKELAITHKENGSPVSLADLEIEKKIHLHTSKTFQNWGIWGEELGPFNIAKDIVLIVDPIDATRNFIRQIPLFATLLAIQVEGKIVAGMVSSPIHRERWWAQKNQGAFFNNNPIHVSKVKTLAKSQLFYGSLFGCEAATVPQTIHHLLSKTDRQRGLGDYYSHALVAMGSGECSVDFGLQPWDMAPFKIIVEEAGGKVTHLNGSFDLRQDSLICSNGLFHKEILEILS